MSAPKHTHGPWRVERQNVSPTTGEWMIAGAKPGYLAEVRDCGSGCAAANARLIAAAPELLEAIEETLTAGINWYETATKSDASELGFVVRARAAIAKAKGES